MRLFQPRSQEELRATKLSSSLKAELKQATLSEEAILASPITKKKVLRVKLRVSQPKWANIQFSRVSVLD